MIKSKPIIESLIKGRFSLLLISMIGMFFIVPLFGSQGVIDKVFGWFSIVVLISCIRAITQTRKFFIFMIVLTVLNVVLSGSEMVMVNESIHFLSAVLLFKIVYFIFVFVSIMRFVLDNNPVTADKMFGAISAYFLMGIIWSFVYTLFHHHNPDCFNVPAEWLSNSYWSVYFSFTTLTTLGYGDITPKTSVTQSYAVMQAAIGQIFLAVIVARLIALQITHERDA